MMGWRKKLEAALEAMDDEIRIVMAGEDVLGEARACLAIYGPVVLHQNWSLEHEVPSVEEYAARISSCLATHPWLLAIHPSLGVVGFAYASTYKPRAGYRWTAETSLYVSPQCQRKQVGSMLYKGLFSILVHLNIRSLFACIALPNEGSVGFHRRQGFEEAGLFRRAGFKQGRWVDCAWMQFQLPHEEDVGHQHQHHQESGCEGGTPPEPRLLAALTALELVALLALSSSSSSSSPSQEPAVHQQCSSERDDQ